MRDLKKNQTLIYYSTYGSGTETDEWGNTIKSYGSPVSVKVSVSPNQGSVNAQSFGADLAYDRTISTTKDLPIDEYTRLWIDIKTSEPHNYVVVGVAKDINQTQYAIKRVKVSEND